MKHFDQNLPQGDQTLVIVPTYNERENLPKIIPAILTIVPKAHILIVDDLSPDGTGKIADQLAEADVRIHVEHRHGQRGLGRAYIHGFKWALEREYEYIFEMDADFSHQPKYLPLFLEAARESDLVLGCRYMSGGGVEGWGPHRLLISRGGNSYARLILGLPYRDLTGGFKCFRRKALQSIDFDRVISNGYNFQIELTWYTHIAGMKITEIPIVFPDRTEGTSKMNVGIFHEAMLGVIRLRLHTFKR
jgi:dolichol-phosphate mannosyltransferase